MLIFVALCVNQFARRSKAAGSLYHYVADGLGPGFGAVGGWALLWAYAFVAAAVLGAMAVFFAQLGIGAGSRAGGVAVVVAIAFIAWQAAYRGVAVWAIVMLVLETVSVSIICVLVVVVLRAHGAWIDPNQLHLTGAFPGGAKNVGLAIAFAVFSYVGFESATAFGDEAQRPLVTIPRAVVGSVLFATAFFVVATYAEIVGFAHAAKPLDAQTFPLGALAQAYGAGFLRIPITIGALCSAFTVCLACITTGGRIAYAMSRAKLLPPAFARIEARHGTPNVAVTVVTFAAFAVAAAAIAFGVAPIDVFNNGGTLSSFGFILAYMLIAVAAAVYSRSLGDLRLMDLAVSLVALLLLIAAAVTLFYPMPAPPQRWFGYYFSAFVGLGWLGYAISARAAKALTTIKPPATLIAKNTMKTQTPKRFKKARRARAPRV